MDTGLVLDASVAISSVLEADERYINARRLLRVAARHGAVVPAIWPFEVGHVLLKKVQQRAIAAPEADRALQRLFALPITVVGKSRNTILSSVWSLALRHRISLYDASYIDLALQIGLSLATFDRPMRGVAEAERVTLLD